MRRLRIAPIILGIAVLVACVLPSYGQEAALAVHRDIAGLTDEAAVIFHGHVVSATVEPHPVLTNLRTVLVTMSVAETLKGSVPKTFVFREYVWDVRARYSSAGYHKGQELLLFLRPVSRYGLTSPAGLQQGRFVISTDAKGKRLATNGNNNAGLFDQLPAKARAHNVVLPLASQKMITQPSGPADLANLQQIVRSFAGTK